MGKREKKGRHGFLFALLLMAALALLPATARETQAATTGFKTVNGKTYYIDADGSKHKGWLTLNGKKYYFNTKTGVQLKGWQTNSKGQKIRYFTSGTGVMVTGFLKNSSGQTRYFSPSTGKMVRGWLTLDGKKYYFTSGSGIMATGWMENQKGQKRYFKSNGQMATGWLYNSKKQARYFGTSNGLMYTGLKKIDGKYYYFAKSNGIRYQKGFGTVGSKKYYFDPSDGHAHTGWLTLDGKKYYFNSKGVMYVSTTAKISGTTYLFDANGVATENSDSKTFTVYDEKNAKNYTLMNEYKTHPGVADKTKSDLDLLAAICEAEAGDQGLEGMEAVALCILNRVQSKDFPSSVRYVIYQGTTFPQYSVVTNGALLKRLNGQFENRTLAYKAAQAALDIYNKYVTDGTKRVIKGFKTKDFKYMYFMTEEAFLKQPLNFDKVKSEKYKDHVFFVKWVS